MTSNQCQLTIGVDIQEDRVVLSTQGPVSEFTKAALEEWARSHGWRLMWASDGSLASYVQTYTYDQSQLNNKLVELQYRDPGTSEDMQKFAIQMQRKYEERRTPNQPFYAKFRKKEKRKR